MKKIKAIAKFMKNLKKNEGIWNIAKAEYGWSYNRK